MRNVNKNSLFGYNEEQEFSSKDDESKGKEKNTGLTVALLFLVAALSLVGAVWIYVVRLSPQQKMKEPPSLSDQQTGKRPSSPTQPAGKPFGHDPLIIYSGSSTSLTPSVPRPPYHGSSAKVGGKCTISAQIQCGSSVGECKSGIQTCTANGWGPCLQSVLPKPEVCDGLDNDCNGVADDGVVCNCRHGDTRVCGSSLGECRPGVQTCKNGEWSFSCIGAVGPSPEICDNLDNDCNGVVDDNCPPKPPFHIP